MSVLAYDGSGSALTDAGSDSSLYLSEVAEESDVEDRGKPVAKQPKITQFDNGDNFSKNTVKV